MAEIYFSLTYIFLCVHAVHAPTLLINIYIYQRDIYKNSMDTAWTRHGRHGQAALRPRIGNMGREGR